MAGSQRPEPQAPLEADGVDPEIDMMATEKAFYSGDEHHHGGRRLSETLIEFAEKFGEGARRISEHWVEDGNAVAGMFTGKERDQGGKK